MKKKFLALYSDIHYLEDSGITLEGLKIYGSPWSPEFGSYWVYNLPRGSRYLKEKWDKVPDDTDILMTHTAPYGILDPNYEYQSVGCELLRDRIIDIKPLISCFGHLHRGYNVKRIDLGNKTTTFINSSICNDNNQVVNKPINLTIENRYVEIIDD
jgi:Icc-related predicted phosphoesterase